MKAAAALGALLAFAAVAKLRGQNGPETRLSPFEVAAQGFLVGDGPDATMTKLGVFETPGAAADIDRALQLLPGVAFVDEGDALYVRGGSARETTLFVDGIPIPFADRAMTPVGTPGTALSPYYVQRASLYAGDVPVRFFDALSGAVEIEAAHAPRGTSALLDAGLGSLSVLLQGADASGTGLVLAASGLDTAATYRLNPSPREFTEYPRGVEGFASFETAIGGDTTADVVGFEQTRRMGFVEDDPSYVGPFVQDTRTGFAVGRVKAAETDGSGWQLAVGGGRDAVAQNFGNLDYASRRQLAALAADRSWALPGGLLVGAGADVLRDSGGLTGAVPSGPSLAPAAPTTPLEYGRRLGQGGVFASANWTMSSRLQAVAGVRADRFGEPAGRAFEPRASLAFQPAPRVSITACAGRIAQAATSVEAASTPSRLPPTRMGEASVGVAGRLAGCRFTLAGYAKTYGDLIQYTRTYQAVGGGVGSARGWSSGSKPNAARVSAPDSTTPSAIPTARTPTRPPWPRARSMCATPSPRRPGRGWASGGSRPRTVSPPGGRTPPPSRDRTTRRLPPGRRSMAARSRRACPT